jgi:hypothetical protein
MGYSSSTGWHFHVKWMSLLPDGHARQRNAGTAAKTTGRSPPISGLLKRLWIPLLVIFVVAAGGFTVSRLHGIFGSETGTRYSDTRASDSKPYDPKVMIYEVFGAPGTIANISYFDETTEPRYIKDISLPWTLQFDISSATAIGSLMAQGDSDNIGCRITVDGEVKAEKTSDNVNAFTSCLLKAA